MRSIGPLAADCIFQKAVEQRAWEMGGQTQTAPAQRLSDFLNGKVSASLPKTSYAPGITPVELGEVLPDFIHRALQGGFRQFGKSMKGFVSNEGVVHAPESRTSSPVRIPRDPEALQHFRIHGTVSVWVGRLRRGIRSRAGTEQVRDAIRPANKQQA